jgi:ribosomal protein S18 acetylase RimI-like enzyme
LIDLATLDSSAIEAACCVRDYARDVLRLPYAVSAILPHNARSQRVAVRGGARVVGEMEVAHVGSLGMPPRDRWQAGLYAPPVSGEPHIRQVRPDDLEEVWRVHVAASNDGLVRRGQPSARPPDAPVASDARAGLASDPDGYFCAVEQGRIRGMVSALIRGRVWYLSMFFVLPGDQSRGLGRALLERAVAYGEARGVEVRCTLATLDPRAQARYVMAGMVPRWPIYPLDADATAVARLKTRIGLDPRTRELPCDPGVAEKLVAEVFGDGRADDLAHFRSDGGTAVAIERGGEIAAFAYRRGNRIGPAAGRDETAFLHAAAAGAGGGGSVTVRVPGACASLLEAMVASGFRIGDPTLFMASRLFGRLELYLPSGPILF